MEELKYKTKDFGEAITLLCEGYKVETLEKTDRPNEFKFVFLTDNNLEECVGKYYRQELLIEPSAILYQQKQLRKLIEQAIRTQALQ